MPDRAPLHVKSDPRAPASEGVIADAARVCLLIPPLWDLDGFVAVNPFVGFSSMRVLDAARAIGDAREATVLPGSGMLRERLRRGTIPLRHLESAARSIGCSVQHLRAILDGQAAPPTRQREPSRTLAECLDRRQGSNWNERVCEYAAAWCAAHAARMGTQVRPPERIFESWLADAALDHGLEISGLGGFRRWVKRIPPSAEAAIAAIMDRVEIPAWDRQSYMYRLLHGVSGWAAWLRRWAWERDREDPGLVLDLLAIRVSLDAAVAELAPAVSMEGVSRPIASVVEDERFALALQDAVEDGLAERFARRLLPPPTTAPISRPAVQGVFCIDVRSERIRRHLETLSPEIETIGFAGFFGMSVEWNAQGQTSRRCPVLVQPGFQAHADGPVAASGGSIVRSLLGAPAAAFIGVETLGLASLVRLVREGLGWTRRPGPDADETVAFIEGLRRALPLDTRVDLAERILLGLGLGDRFARLILLCGHQGCSVNNAHAASLHCGACGGRGGALNARMAAAILNDGAVRSILAAAGRLIPRDTQFIAGVHDTSGDEVRLLDLEALPQSHALDLERMRRWLAAAGDAARAERAVALGIEEPSRSRAPFDRRAADWSETRPEWGLAGNALFIAARRARTREVDLEGRAFLHEYDESLDPDASVLELVLSAPMVVASWISLQYLASTVDPVMFGAGDKNLLNRVGALGVSSGDRADLRSGLPLQSIVDRHGEPFHEPVRLQVFVEASSHRIEQVLERQPAVRELVEHGWVRLFSLSPNGATVARWKPGLGWESFFGEEGTEAGLGQVGRGSSRRQVDVPQQPRPRASSSGQGS